MEPRELWAFIGWGYLLTVSLETPVLLLGLARRHPIRRRWFAGFWLTACSYPIVVVVLPIVMADTSRTAYMWVAEIFAPLSECLIFFLAFPPDASDPRKNKTQNSPKHTYWQDGTTIIVANLFSFPFGEFARSAGWMNW